MVISLGRSNMSSLYSVPYLIFGSYRIEFSCSSNGVCFSFLVESLGVLD